MFPQLPVHPSTECTRTDTLNSDPLFIFEDTCNKTQSQTNRHPSINCHGCRIKPLPPSILLLSTCVLTPSVHSFPVIDQCYEKAVPQWALIRPRFPAYLYAPLQRPLLTTITAHKMYGSQTIGPLYPQRLPLFLSYHHLIYPLLCHKGPAS